MAAAGLGNLISDVCGIGAGSYIEAVSGRLGLPDPHLSKAQVCAFVFLWRSNPLHFVCR